MYKRTQYGLYQDAVRLTRAGKDSEKWNNAIYWVFDSPSLNLPYEVSLL